MVSIAMRLRRETTMTVGWIAGCGEQFIEPEMKVNITMCGTDHFTIGFKCAQKCNSCKNVYTLKIIKKIETFWKRIFRTWIDDLSWIESADRESYFYCEQHRRFQFDIDVVSKDKVVLIVVNPVCWSFDDGSSSVVDERDVDFIFDKLRKHFQDDWGYCELRKKS